MTFCHLFCKLKGERWPLSPQKLTKDWLSGVMIFCLTFVNIKRRTKCLFSFSEITLKYILVWRHLYMHSNVQTPSRCVTTSRTHWVLYPRVIDQSTTDISIKQWLISFTDVSTIKDCMAECKTNEILSADNRYICTSLSLWWFYMYTIVFQINTKTRNRCPT